MSSLDERTQLAASLSPLPRPVYFVIRYAEKWAELFDDATCPAHLHDQHWRIVSLEEILVVQTFVQLRALGLDVRVTPSFVPGEINVASGLDFGIKDRPEQSFTVAVRGDGYRPELADVVIAHSTAVMQPEDFWLPCWVQTGLIPRDADRGTRVERVEFKGDEMNLDARFKTPDFLTGLERLGCRFAIGGLDLSEQNKWNDYRKTDVILAARDLPVGDVAVKPPNKLVNAWAAGTPALLGPEPAYLQLRRGPLDFIEVNTGEQALAAVELLIDQPRLYEAMVDNGRRRAENFTDEAIAIRWHTLLGGPIHDRFLQWSTERPALRSVRFMQRSVAHKRSMRTAAYHRTNGDGLLSGPADEPKVAFDDPYYGLGSTS